MPTIIFQTLTEGTLFWKSSSVHNFPKSVELGCNDSHMFWDEKPAGIKGEQKDAVSNCCVIVNTLWGSDEPSLEAGRGQRRGRHTVPIICNLACGLSTSSAQTRWQMHMWKSERGKQPCV